MQPFAPIKHYLLSSLFFLLLIVLTFIIPFHIKTLFPIRLVRVQGPFEHVSPSDLKQVLIESFPSGFFTMPLKQLRTRLLASQPWLNEASVRRIWPDTVMVRFTEKKAIARWRKGGLILPSGQVFYGPLGQEDTSKKLPLLEGDHRQIKRLIRTYAQLVELVDPFNLHIKSLSVDQEDRWSLYLDEDILIQMGIGVGRGLARLKRFLKSYHTLLHDQADTIKTIDLRYPDAFAIRWRAQNF